MSDPVEVVDDLTATVTTGKLQFTVRNPPYLPGSVSVFRNGMLQDASWWTEDDPTLGTVTLFEPILLREEEDHAIHIAYETYQQVYVDPYAPVHISKLKLGDVLRIAMRAGRHLEPVVNKKKQNQLLVMKTKREGCRKVSGRAAKGFSRTVFFGYLTLNDSVNGEMHLQVEGRDRIRRDHLLATVRYSDILSIRKYVTPSVPHNTSKVGGGPRAERHPGVEAKGVRDAPGFMKLVRVFY